MADEVELSVDTRALEAALSGLPEKVAKRYARAALQAGGDVILAAMKAHAPERTDEPTPDSDSLPPGILKEDLQTQITITDNGAHVKIGPTAVSAHVARWQNNGWMLTSHDGKKIRQMPGKHFMEAAGDEAGEAAIDAIVESLSDSLADALNTNDAGGDGSHETL